MKPPTPYEQYGNPRPSSPLKNRHCRQGVPLPQQQNHSFGPRRSSYALRWQGCSLAAHLFCVAFLVASGCATRATTEIERAPRHTGSGRAAVDIEVLQRAETQRADRLAAQVERLQTDLKQAEEALVLAESGLRESHSRADAVSNLAEARIEVDRAAAAAPWRVQSIERAQTKLAEADRQIQQRHFGAALFFVYRARRLATTVEEEARKVYSQPGTRFIHGRRVNLRAGPSTSQEVLFVLSQGTPVFPEDRDHEWVLVRTPSGSLGWVHGGLLASADRH